MDRHTQLSTPRVAASARWRRGAAMASALFAIAVAAILTAGVHWMTRADIRTASNRESALRALTVAEAGLAHALALVKGDLGDTTMTRLLRGWDGNRTTAADNGMLTGYNLPTATQIPATGRAIEGGTYYVRMTDDPAEVDNDTLTDRNTRLRVICRGVTPDGATATINAIVGNASLAGLSINGDLTISGTTTLSGRCGGVHTNGNLSLGTALTVETRASATGTVSGTVRNTYGETLPNEAGAAAAEFPTLAASDYCGRADYEVLTNNTILVRATGVPVALATLGWSGSWPLWTVMSNVTPGTYCVNGNVKMSNTVGASGAPRAISLIVKGSLEVSGSQFLVPDDNEGIAFLVDGDLKLNGNSTFTTPDFNGFIYAGAQCDMSGSLFIEGQVICKNGANPPGSEAWASENKISGTTRIIYGCRGFLSQLWRVISWYPTPG
jgi:hypothetical protein